jgi:hypothetical protein
MRNNNQSREEKTIRQYQACLPTYYKELCKKQRRCDQVIEYNRCLKDWNESVNTRQLNVRKRNRDGKCDEKHCDDAER